MSVNVSFSLNVNVSFNCCQCQSVSFSVIVSVGSQIWLCCSHFTVRTPWPAYLGAKANLVVMRIWAVEHFGTSTIYIEIYVQEDHNAERARKILYPTDVDDCDGNFIFDALWTLSCVALLQGHTFILLACSIQHPLHLLLFLVTLWMTARYFELAWRKWKGTPG